MHHQISGEMRSSTVDHGDQERTLLTHTHDDKAARSMDATARRPKAPAELLLLHIELNDIEPTIWRRFLVPETITLGKLHRVIQAVMGWTDSHLHEFDIAGEKYGTPSSDDWGAPVNSETRKTLVNALQGKKRFGYLYDFGDSWEHRITVEKRLPMISAPQEHYCIEGENACPPEDVGGALGYQDFLDAMANPAHPDHDDRVEWYGGVFEASVYDCKPVNQWLARKKI